MFSYETLEAERNLELALQLIPEEMPQAEEKETISQKIKNYFLGDSNIWYEYSYDEKTNSINYTFPRTFVADIKNIASKYFSKINSSLQ